MSYSPNTARQDDSIANALAAFHRNDYLPMIAVLEAQKAELLRLLRNRADPPLSEEKKREIQEKAGYACYQRGQLESLRGDHRKEKECYREAHDIDPQNKIYSFFVSPKS